ncbi:hydrogenase small subunit [Neomoorella thermoacetica]|uniref:hydrogenase small subunit n=1 Tax=Neomoorella thermoacetica TaxID=1525 RepID=UPI0008FAB07E|nr:hydrogenase small subunit [Moorella thermoacetica]OIQ12658.1 periplasmic [NiFe] hydrogenase small subunit precursor [Moorella thermoacetica]
MTEKEQFALFCHLHKHTPGFSRQLAELFGKDLLASVPKPPLVWLEANACSGDSISTLNTVKPGLGQVICSLLDIKFWNALMPGQGAEAIESLLATVEAGNFILIVEGAIATRAGGKFTIPFKTEERLFTSEELIRWMAPRAKYIVAVGTCAAFGGPSAARPNPSGSKGVWEVIREPVVNVSGCPINPDWLVGTLIHLLLYGFPEVDRYQRPTLFYGQTIHVHCQRRSYFDTGALARNLGDRECMFSLGCMGPVTGADCPYRLWNDHLNWPVKASTPCIGCTKAGFPDKATPFYTPLPGKIPGGTKDGKK